MKPAVQSHNYTEARKLLYRDGMPIDISIEKRIRFFSFRSFGKLGDEKEFFTLLTLGKKIIGIANVGYYSMNAKHQKNWSISYLSIDIEHRCKGYSKILVDELFREAKARGLDISTSAYTVLGKEQLQKQFNRYAEIHGVVFHDKTEEDSLIDANWMYTIVDGKKLHNDECDGWNKTNTFKIPV